MSCDIGCIAHYNELIGCQVGDTTEVTNINILLAAQWQFGKEFNSNSGFDEILKACKERMADIEIKLRQPKGPWHIDMSDKHQRLTDLIRVKALHTLTTNLLGHTVGEIYFLGVPLNGELALKRAKILLAVDERKAYQLYRFKKIVDTAKGKNIEHFEISKKDSIFILHIYLKRKQIDNLTFIFNGWTEDEFIKSFQSNRDGYIEEARADFRVARCISSGEVPKSKERRDRLKERGNRLKIYIEAGLSLDEIGVEKEYWERLEIILKLNDYAIENPIKYFFELHFKKLKK